MTPTWHCREMTRGEPNVDPIQEEFFTPKADRAEGLVRESVQNALDAAANGGRVTVRYTFPLKSLDLETSEKYLKGLRPHLEASLTKPLPLSEPMDYLLIEDFGTRGLRGDPLQDYDDPQKPDTEKNDFYYFWRNIGRSSKSETDRGRWGLGKTVFPAASKINSFFGFTVRQDDGKAFLMGQSVLKVHYIDKRRYCPYAYFGSTGEDNFTEPVIAFPSLEEFRRDFGIDRTKEAGLSIVIPYPRRDEIRPDDILRASIRNYFYPILGGTLVIELKYDGKRTVLDSATVRHITEGLDWSQTDTRKDQLLALLDLARWAISLPPDNFIKLKEQGAGAPTWKEDLFPDGDLNAIRARLEKGERLAFHVPIRTERKNGPSASAYFKVFLVRDTTLDRGQDHYIRQGITITDIRMLREAEVRGLVVIDDKELSTLLGDSENPAHTDWQERSTKLKERFTHGPSCVRFVRRSLRDLVAFLSKPPEGLHERLLEDLFFVDKVVSTAGPGNNGGRKRNGDDTVKPNPPPPAPAIVRLEKLSGGFRVSGKEGLSGALDIDVAYEVRRGNPFKKYDPNDFDLSKAPINVAAKKAAISTAAGNRLRVMIQSDDFEVKVTGFDPNRDLKVRVRHEPREETT